MSRGLGKIERAVLAVLKEKPGPCHVESVTRYSTLQIAAAVYGLKGDREKAERIAARNATPISVDCVQGVLARLQLTASQKASVRRALYALAKAGLVVCLGKGRDREMFWMEEQRWCMAEAARWQMDNVAIYSVCANPEAIFKRSESMSAAVERGLAMQARELKAGE